MQARASSQEPRNSVLTLSGSAAADSRLILSYRFASRAPLNTPRASSALGNIVATFSWSSLSLFVIPLINAIELPWSPREITIFHVFLVFVYLHIYQLYCFYFILLTDSDSITVIQGKRECCILFFFLYKYFHITILVFSFLFHLYSLFHRNISLEK